MDDHVTGRLKLSPAIEKKLCVGGLDTIGKVIDALNNGSISQLNFRRGSLEKIESAIQKYQRKQLRRNQPQTQPQPQFSQPEPQQQPQQAPSLPAQSGPTVLNFHINNQNTVTNSATSASQAASASESTAGAAAKGTAVAIAKQTGAGESRWKTWTTVAIGLLGGDRWQTDCKREARRRNDAQASD
jgi:hypothetical protein